MTIFAEFANVLEQLETEFYSQALQKFQTSDFTAAGFSDASVPVQQFTNIQFDESTHTTVLDSAIQSLGDSAITGCSFDFSSVLTDVATMAPVARLVENVGVGAYLGAAHLVTDPIILTSAASIVTVEARHQTMLNVLNGGTAIPAPFDLPLLPLCSSSSTSLSLSASGTCLRPPQQLLQHPQMRSLAPHERTARMVLSRTGTPVPFNHCLNAYKRLTCCCS